MSEYKKNSPDTSYQQPDTKFPVVRVKLDLSFLKAKYLVLFLAVATGVAGATIAIYAYNKVGIENSLNIPIIEDSERMTAKDIENLVEKMSQVAVLPEDETPTVLTISDLTKLHSNPFFKDAKLKDKILIFKKAGRIILYDPLGHKIVNMGPYSEPEQEATPAANPIPPSSNESTKSAE